MPAEDPNAVPPPLEEEDQIGSGGGESGADPQGGPVEDQDAEPSLSPELVDADSERDQAEG